jgi:hypothetical protein
MLLAICINNALYDIELELLSLKLINIHHYIKNRIQSTVKHHDFLNTLYEYKYG